MSKSIRGACNACQAPFGICVCDQNQQTQDWQVPPLPEKELRARLEKVRDKLAECRHSSVRCSAQIRNEEALRMLEAILNGDPE